MAQSLAVAAILAVVVAAAVATRYLPPKSGTGASAATGSPGASATSSPEPPGTIRWFVGLDGGLTPTELAAEKAFVARYNATNTDGITLELDNPQEIIPDADPFDVLKTQIAAGVAPDIIGPAGLTAMNPFEGLFANLNPQIAANHVDLSVFEPRILQLLRQDGAQVGLPYTVNPGFIFYNKDLFTRAGLPLPPTQVGAPYLGKTWDWNELAAIAARLTLDGSGRHPGDAGFDSGSIVQFGIDFPGADARVMASTFGAGSFVADDGRTAQIPPAWAEAFNWYYKAMWTSHVAPTAEQESGALLHGNSIASGHVAMALSRSSDIGTYGSPGNATFGHWGMAVIPSWGGQTTSPVGVQTFAITKMAVHPDLAFKAMLAIEADESLSAVYGGMPGSSALRDAWFASQQSAQVDWSVLPTMESYAAVPGPEANMPSLTQTTADYTAWFTRLRSVPGLNVATELDKLRQTLQIDWDSSGPGVLAAGPT